MKCTLDVGSGWWVGEDLKVVVDKVWNHKADVMLVFPTMNEVDVGEVHLRFNDCEMSHPEPIAMPKGIYGRAIEMRREGMVHIPKLKMTVKLLSSERGRERASFEVEFLS